MRHAKERIEYIDLLKKCKIGDETIGAITLRALRLLAAVRNRDNDTLLMDGLNGLKASYPNDLAFANAGFTLGVVRAVLAGALGPIEK